MNFTISDGKSAEVIKPLSMITSILRWANKGETFTIIKTEE